MRLFKYPAHIFFSLTLICLGILGFSTSVLPPTQAQNSHRLTMQPDTAGTWRRGGPDGGTASVLAFHPTNPSIVFAGGSGLFRSSDGGAHWTETVSGLTNFSIRTIAFTPTNPAVMYVGTTHGRQGEAKVFKSTNGGDTWTPVGAGLTFGTAEKVVVHPQDPNLVYVIFFGTVQKSTDAGVTWSPSGTGLPAFFARDELLIDPVHPENMYVSCGPQGVYKSLNGGDTWIPVNQGLPANFFVRGLAMGRLVPTTLYVGDYNLGLYRSLDGGATWTPLAPFAGNLTSFAVDAFNTNRLYVGTYTQGVLKSEDGGATWLPVNTGLPQLTIALVSVSLTNPSLILISTLGSGVYLSNNLGSTWSAANTGLFFNDVQAVAVVPSQPGTVYAGIQSGGGSGGGIAKSTDGARTWTRLNLGDEFNIFSLAIHPANPNLVLAGGGPILKSTDAGASWQPAASIPNTFVSMISFSVSKPNVVFATCKDFGVYKSTDAGSTWAAANQGITDLNTFGVAVAPTDANQVYLATNSGKIYKSLNEGGNWTLMQTGLPGASNGAGLVIDPTNPNFVYAAFLNGGVYKTSNGGVTWTASNNGFGANAFGLATDPANGAVLYATQPNGVFRSLDRGQNWTLLPLAGLNTLTPGEIQPTLQSGILYVGGDGGVFAFGELTCPTVTRFYPVSSEPGKTLTITGTNFVPGTQVFFGGPRLIPAANVTIDSTTQIRVVVPPTSGDAGNVNGYLTIRVAGCADVTTETLPVNVSNPADPNSTFPRFVLWGDPTLDGRLYNANDVALTRGFVLLQATPTPDQMLAADVVPANGNGSRGNGVLTSTDFAFLRAHSFGQINEP